MDLLLLIRENSFLLATFGAIVGTFIGMYFEIMTLKRRVTSLHARQDKLENERMKQIEQNAESQGKLLAVIEERTKNTQETAKRIDERIEQYLIGNRK